MTLSRKKFLPFFASYWDIVLGIGTSRKMIFPITMCTRKLPIKLIIKVKLGCNSVHTTGLQAGCGLRRDQGELCLRQGLHSREIFWENRLCSLS